MNVAKKILLMVMVFGILFISSCSKDDEPVDQTSLDLIGVWESSSVQLLITVGGVSLFQYYVDEMGLTEEEAEEEIQLVGNLIVFFLHIFSHLSLDSEV